MQKHQFKNGSILCALHCHGYVHDHPVTFLLEPNPLVILVLHPQLKLKYFQQHGWSQDWISTAEAIVREEFAKYDTLSLSTPVLVCPVLSIVFHTTCLPPHDSR
ncbi:hypothetical protein L208DRAFT_1253524 [Tricholoma matsutake]|nr:hypothetical protein L208DRAFT_1253524 [Tricholoma matsutake 945]